MALAGLLGVAAPADAAQDCPRGNLDVGFCDRNGDLVADTPTDPSKLLDPDTLIFSYTPVEDPSVSENVFTEFMDYLAQKTGKKVKWYGAESYAAQVEAMRSGRLHVAGISTGPTVFGVNLAGYVPIAIMGKADGQFGYRLQLITHKDSDIKTIADLKGRKVAHVTPSSNSGNQAPRALFKSLGVVPGEDYEVIYSGKHDNSIMGVANKDYDAAPIASSILDRMHAKGIVNTDAGPADGGDGSLPDLRLDGHRPEEGVRQEGRPVHSDHLQGALGGHPDDPGNQRRHLYQGRPR